MFGAGAITSTLGLDISPFTSGMLQAQSIARLFPQVVQDFIANPLLGLVSVARSAAGAVTGAFFEFAKKADDAGDAAERLGVGVEFLTSVGKAAEDAGGSIQGFEDSLKLLQNNAADAAAGVDTAVKAFASVGLSAVDAHGQIKPTEQLFYELADAMAALPTSAQRTQAAMNLLGRGGGEMTAFMGQGSGAIKQFAQQVIDMGGAVDGNSAAIADKFGKLNTLFNAMIGGWKKAAAVPILLALAGNFDDVTKVLGTLAEVGQKAIGQLIQPLAPLIQKLLPIAMYLGQIVSIVADALSPAIESLAGLVGEGLVAAFEILTPVIKLVAVVLKGVLELLKPIIDAITWIIEKVGAVASGIGEALGLSSAPNVGALMGGSSSGNAGGGAASGGTQVNVGQMKFEPIDYRAASSQIADQVKGPLKQQVEEQFSKLQASTSAAIVARGL